MIQTSAHTAVSVVNGDTLATNAWQHVVVVADGTPCLGPVTHAGCGALCPSHNRGCYGCFGPSATPRIAILIPLLRRDGMSDGDVERVFSTFNVAAFNTAAFDTERRTEGDKP